MALKMFKWLQTAIAAIQCFAGGCPKLTGECGVF